MSTINPSPSTFAAAYPQARRAAEVHAARAVRTGRVLPDDRDDIVQDAVFALWRELPSFDPTRSSLSTFVERVVVTRTASSIRDRGAMKRAAGEPLVFHPEVASPAASIEFRVEFERVLRRLTPFDRKVARQLVDRTPAETARALRIARSSVYLSIARIRDAFAAAGLDPCQRAGIGRKNSIPRCVGDRTLSKRAAYIVSNQAKPGQLTTTRRNAHREADASVGGL